MIVLSSTHTGLALRREGHRVDIALVPGQSEDRPRLEEVVNLDLPVTGSRHAEVAAGMEGEAVDRRLVSVVELLELPGSDVEYLDVVVAGGHSKTGATGVELTLQSEPVVDVEGVERLAGH